MSFTSSIKCAGVVAGAFFCLVSAATAHDFWMEPVGQPNSREIAIALYVGHAGERARWGGAHLITATSLHSADDSVGDRSINVDRDNARLVIAPPSKPASALMAAMTSGNSYSELTADEFNAYVEEEGLAAVRAHRLYAGISNSSGRERYSRRAKTLIQLTENAEAAFALEPVGHELEIVPMNDPFSPEPDSELRFRVLFDETPLENAQVSFENLDVGLFGRQTGITDKNGVVAFNVTNAGAWKANVVWSTPLSAKEDTKADYETIFSSFTFSDKLASSDRLPAD